MEDKVHTNYYYSRAMDGLGLKLHPLIEAELFRKKDLDSKRLFQHENGNKQILEKRITFISYHYSTSGQ